MHMVRYIVAVDEAEHIENSLDEIIREAAGAAGTRKIVVAGGS